MTYLLSSNLRLSLKRACVYFALVLSVIITLATSPIDSPSHIVSDELEVELGFNDVNLSLDVIVENSEGFNENPLVSRFPLLVRRFSWENLGCPILCFFYFCQRLSHHRLGL